MSSVRWSLVAVAGIAAAMLAGCQSAQESAITAEMTCRQAGLRPGTATYDRCVAAAYDQSRRQADQAATAVAVGTAAGVVGGAIIGANSRPYYGWRRCNAWGCW
ncbi:hypothetical protein ACFFJB_10195 [Camelimonas abortus]|uniref:Lipoprotein n=1 Tax=Camelimonas abortus TaxID=1017184 RepID=A0ABV7LBD7_9HYPH